MVTTKIYKNTSDEPINVLGVGEIPAGEQISISSEYHQPVVLSNYPGVVDITEEEVADIETPPETPPAQPPQEEQPNA